MKQAIGYIRVSTENQAGDDRFGMEAQRTEIQRYADNHGYAIVEWVCDEVSGCCENPPGLSGIMFGDVQNPPYEAVIAFKSDRIARDTKLYFYRLYVLEKKGIKLISTQQNFEDDALANVYRALLMFVAEQERKNINMRTTNGRTVKAKRGGYSGGNSPYGYCIRNKGYAINEEEAETVREIFHLRNIGHSMVRIAHMLNAEMKRSRSGAEWTQGKIKSILDNERTYRGEYHYADCGWVAGEHEAILKGV